jgi:dihydrodipicolinate synthase/N-acetylneuraminate lyase
MFRPSGIYAAMLTPFDHQRRVNEPVLRELVDFMIAAGLHGLFPCSSSGEFARLSDAERRLVIEIVVDHADGRVPIVAGVGAPSPDQVIAYAREAQALGCTAVVVCPPYYYTNIPAESVTKHFSVIAGAIDIPIILYNIPVYCAPLSPAQVALLCNEFPHIVAVKDSSLNMATFNHLLDLTARARNDFAVLTGGDEMLYPALVMGGAGGMLISAGVVPEVSVALYARARAGNHDGARRLQLALLNLMRVMGSVPFPAGFKLGLEARGFPDGADRQPLGREGQAAREQARPVVGGLIKQLLDELRAETSSVRAR